MSHTFRHFPVVEKRPLVGMVTDSDIAILTGWILAEQRHATWGMGPHRVGENMQEALICLNEDATVQDAAHIILEKRIGAIPVLRGQTIVGIVTISDLLRASTQSDSAEDWKVRPDAEVADWMSKPAVLATPENSVYEALDLCKEHGVRHVPVVEDIHLVGIISDRDLRYGLEQEIVSDRIAQSEGRMVLGKTPVTTLMALDVISLDVSNTLADATTILLEHRFSALPVLDKGHVVGIGTHTDLLLSCCWSVEGTRMA